MPVDGSTIGPTLGICRQVLDGEGVVSIAHSIVRDQLVHMHPNFGVVHTGTNEATQSIHEGVSNYKENTREVMGLKLLSDRSYICRV
jgi:hypothetical protein